MGRHKAMQSAVTEPTQDTTSHDPAHHAETTEPSSAEYVRPRRLTFRTLPPGGKQRYDALISTTGIRVPAGPLRVGSVHRAATCQAHTAFVSEVVDRKSVRVIARCLHDDALDHQSVDEFRALTRDAVNRWLVKESRRVSQHSLRTYDQVLSRVGRLLYPQQYPLRSPASAPRQKGRTAAAPGAAEEMYAVAASLRQRPRVLLLMVLDLVTGAGLRPGEIRSLRGSDFSVVSVGRGHEVVVVRIRGSKASARVGPNPGWWTRGCNQDANLRLPEPRAS